MSGNNTFELTGEQKASIEKIAAEPTRAALIADTTGSGKTIVAVYTLLHPLVNAKKTLVICPVSTFDSWRDTLEDHAPHLPVFDVNTKTYASALKQWQDPEATGVWLIGREWFSTATTDLWHKKEVFQQGKLRKVDDKDKPPKRAAKWGWRKYGKLFDVIVYDEALALTTPIATPDGWKTVGDLRVGDFVFGDDGEPVEILRLTPIRYDAKTFRVHFDDGTYIDADAGHIWSAKPVGSTYSRPWREVTTGTIFDSNKEWTLPSHGAIQYPEKELPMDPYILGQWLGNGSKGQPHFWVRSELLDQTAQEFEARGTKTWGFGKTNPTGSVTRLHFSPFPMNLRDKELPIVYKYGSVSQRLDLLRGLMDSDGHVHKKNHTFTFTNTRLSLIEAVKEIVEGLGFKARVYGVQDNQYTVNSCYRVVFSGTDFDPFLLRDVGHGGLANPHAPKIIRVEPIESVPVRCIEVDNESHLFLAGRSLHVTHNCHAASNRNSQNSASLRQIEPKRLKIAMSATYQGDKFQGAWAVCRWLWKDQTHEDGTPIVDGSFWRWANQWAIVEFSAFAEGGKQVGAERNPGAFVKSLPCYTRTVTAKKPYQIYRCPLQLGPVQAQQYNSMRDTSIAWLNDHPLVADLPIVQKTRLRQMLLGTIDLSDEDEVVFPEDTVSVKFEALLKIIEREPGEKILVFVDSKKIPPIFADRLNQQGLKAAHWTGGVSKVRRAKIKERFMLPYDDPDAVNFLVASTTSISDGTNGLQWVCHTEVWLSKAMSGIKNEQAEGRLNRRGQEAERITRFELFVPGTADDEDYERNARKALMRSQELAIL